MNKKELEDKINDLEPYKKKCEEQEVEIRRLKQEIEQLKDKDNHLEKIMQVLQSSGISNKINSATASTMRPTDDNDDPENDIYYDDPVV
jgi:DNA-binding protein H-NS